ncbi:hypothetical protein LTR56_005394 [Elasticomyces elasticus]|nr:hypothetical protein LTR22_020625 [Elasticomyces elasticus]KAK3651886.1 hypothetical protein LTR56_005394 [Elasticomyces elasticus]KAK5761452.1 hypothetical protein LTS12_008414 [Elasticomyces elasticus]
MALRAFSMLFGLSVWQDSDMLNGLREELRQHDDLAAHMESEARQRLRSTDLFRHGRSRTLSVAKVIICTGTMLWEAGYPGEKTVTGCLLAMLDMASSMPAQLLNGAEHGYCKSTSTSQGSGVLSSPLTVMLIVSTTRLA